MRTAILLLCVLSSIFGLTSSASAQDLGLEGQYESVNPDGTAVYPGHRIEFDIEFLYVDWEGEHYATHGRVINNVTGQVVAVSEGWIDAPLDGEGPIVVTSGSNGSTGTVTPVAGGGWTISYPYGNTRRLVVR